MKRVLLLVLVLGLLLNSTFAGNIPSVQTKNNINEQIQKVLNFYQQIHEFSLYQYTIASNQNKVILKKILNLPMNNLIIKVNPLENRISFFDKAKETFISFNNQKEFIEQLNKFIGYKRINPIVTAILVGVTVVVLGDIAVRIEHWVEKKCYDGVCKIVRAWEERTVIGHVNSGDGGISTGVSRAY